MSPNGFEPGQNIRMRNYDMRSLEPQSSVGKTIQMNDVRPELRFERK